MSSELPPASSPTDEAVAPVKIEQEDDGSLPPSVSTSTSSRRRSPPSESTGFQSPGFESAASPPGSVQRPSVDEDDVDISEMKPAQILSAQRPPPSPPVIDLCSDDEDDARTPPSSLWNNGSRARFKLEMKEEPGAATAASPPVPDSDEVGQLAAEVQRAKVALLRREAELKRKEAALLDLKVKEMTRQSVKKEAQGSAAMSNDDDDVVIIEVPLNQAEKSRRRPKNRPCSEQVKQEPQPSQEPPPSSGLPPTPPASVAEDDIDGDIPPRDDSTEVQPLQKRPRGRPRLTEEQKADAASQRKAKELGIGGSAAAPNSGRQREDSILGSDDMQELQLDAPRPEVEFLRVASTNEADIDAEIRDVEDEKIRRENEARNLEARLRRLKALKRRVRCKKRQSMRELDAAAAAEAEGRALPSASASGSNAPTPNANSHGTTSSLDGGQPQDGGGQVRRRKPGGPHKGPNALEKRKTPIRTTRQRKPPTAYTAYYREERLKLGAEFSSRCCQNPEAEMAIEIGKRWKALSPDAKQKYRRQFQDSMRVYRSRLAAKKIRKIRKKPNGPKRPWTPFLFFCQEQRRKAKEENWNKDELGKAIGKLWSAMGPEERQPYKQKSIEASQKYRQEMLLFKQAGVAADQGEEVEEEQP